jgi:anti-anti-sigma regulatory factor
LDASDHVCWTYSSDKEFRSAAAVFLAEGAELGQQLLYVAERALHEDLVELDGRDELIASGTLRLVRLEELYDVGEPVNADEQLARYAKATDRAVADGHNGLRVVAEITSMVRDPARRTEWARWELAVERYMASGNPLAALCCYDLRILGERGADAIVCVHPLVHGPHTQGLCRLYGNGRDLALAGEIDGFSVEHLGRMLGDLDENVSLDLSAVEFIDHHGLLELAGAQQRLAESGFRLSFTGVSASVRRTARVLGELLPPGLRAWRYDDVPRSGYGQPPR